MTARAFRIGAVAALLLVVQQAFMVKVSIFGVHPDLLLLFALCVGITGGPDRGAIAGFAAGLAADAFLPSPLGLSALAYTVAGYAVGSWSDDTNDLPWVTGAVAVLGTVLALTLFVAFGHIGGDVHAGFGRTVVVILVIALTNGVLSPFIAHVLRPVWRSPRELLW